MTSRLFILTLFISLLATACVHQRGVVSGIWIGKARTAIEAEGQTLMKSSTYRYELNPDGTCTVTVNSLWEIDGAETVSEFSGIWEQHAQTITVKYNLLDEKNASADYATTPRDWNEVRHVFEFVDSGAGLLGMIDKKTVHLTRE